MILDDYPLHTAVYYNDEEWASMLVKYVDINGKNSEDSTALVLAVDQDNITMAKLLLENGANPEIPEDNYYPLHSAVQLGSLDMFKLLMEYQVCIDRRTEHGRHSIHLAAEFGRLEFVKHFLELGICVDLTDKNQSTPLFRAVQSEKENIVKFLIEHNANVNQKDNNGNNPLHIAVQVGNKNITELLIRNGAKLNEKNCFGWAPINFAVYHFEILKILYESGAKFQLNGKCRRYSPLHLAAECGYIKIIDYFLSKGADINFQNEFGYTLLHAAVRNNKTQLATFLVERGADINITTKSKNYSALDFAARVCNPCSINMLIQYRANFEVKSNGECRLLDLVSEKCSTDLSPSVQQNHKLAATVVVKYVALRNRHAPLFLPQNFPFFNELSYTWSMCKQELERMDNNYIGNTTISQYKILRALFDDIQLATYLNNEELSTLSHNLRGHIKVSSMYNNIDILLKTGMERGRLRNTLLNYADYIMSEKITRKLPLEIRRKIKNYLSVEDLAVFVEL